MDSQELEDRSHHIVHSCNMLSWLGRNWEIDWEGIAMDSRKANRTYGRWIGIFDRT